ncbi:MAG: fimbria/pilus outer membrane usher protein [Proteobacteria bacterium]|nr:fimbria/pilus outer membrane usher protein [Pseudomonadota bacterium]
MIKFYSQTKAVILNLFLLLVLNISYSFGQNNKNEIVLSISINGEKKGDLFCILEDKNIYIPLEDFKEFGLKQIGGDILNIDGKDYLNIKTWQGVKLTFNEEMLELDIIIPPEFLKENTINLSPKRRQNVFIPEQNSAFLNYRFDFINTEKDKDLFLNHELGIRFWDITFLTKGFYYDLENKYTRLDTTVYYDDRKNLTRLSIGDFLTPSSPTASGNNMLGVSYHRHFNLDPYFIYKPTFDIRTFATFRSEVEIYLDNTLIKKETIPPGPLNLLDLYYYGGRKDIKILIKDPFGRIEAVSYPFYFTDVMLKKGVREFNYSLGFLRENYSLESNRYSYLDVVALERYGYNDYLNIGGRIELIPAKDYYNLNAETTFLLKNYGVLGLLGAYSALDGKSGTAVMASYSFQQKNIGFRATGFASSENYTGFYKKNSEQITKSFSTGISYYLHSFGSLSIDFIHNKYKDLEKNLINIGYTKSIKGNISFFANFTKKYEKNNSNEFFIGLSIYPKKDYTLSARLEDTEGRTSEILQIAKSAPVGEGYGYRVTLEKEKTKNNAYVINPYFQYRTNFSVIEIDGLMKDREDKLYESLRLAYSGAVSYVAGKVGFTRPINDSFALINVGDIPNVKIELNGQRIGKTNNQGYIFLPDLNSYYDNLITINDKDIPFEYDILTKEIAVSPWYKSGFCLNFPVEKVYRYSGFLIGNFDGIKKPLESHEILIENFSAREREKNSCINLIKDLYEKEIKIITGKDGEFYIEKLKPGTYRAKLILNNSTLDIELPLRDAGELINNLGELEIKIPKDHEKISPFIPLENKENVIANQKEREKSIKDIEISLPIETIKSEIHGEKQVKLIDNKIEDRIYKVFFHFNSTKLVSKDDFSILDKVANIVKEDTKKYIKIEGHCDQLGTKKYNYKLGLKRAKFVKNYLIKNGVLKDKIIGVKSCGEEKLICDSLTESCRKLNRRAEIYLINKE